MLEDERALLMELAYILYRRNSIEIRRRRAKSKISYYEELKRVIKEYKRLSMRIASHRRSLRASDDAFQSTLIKGHIAELQCKLDNLKNQKMKPFKFMDRVSELNKRILKHRAEYVQARYETARLTCSTRKRLGRLLKLLKCNIDYQMGTGFVEAILFKGRRDPIPHTEFEAMAREVEANRAIERMLRSNGKKEKCDQEKT